MNERIKELSNIAYMNHMERNPHSSFGRRSDYDKEFAELIVQECMKVAVNKDSGYMHPADVAGYMAAGRSTAAQMIKEHFGVEE
jgi:hypothetical protein